jgi:hypothetical protein
MEWVVRNREGTKRLNADGTRPMNYGWFPPGRVDDGTVGTSIFNDANLWFGLAAMTRVLEEIGHARAKEFRAAADEYRSCIQDGERRSAAGRPLMRLNDGTWVPYLPGYLDRPGNEMAGKAKYTSVVDTAWAWGMLDTQVFPAGSPENQWLVRLMEDSYSPLVPGLPDEPFCIGPIGEYLQDIIDQTIRIMARQERELIAREFTEETLRDTA